MAEYRYKKAVVIGNGRLALDCAVLIKFLCHHGIDPLIKLLDTFQNIGLFQRLFYKLILVFIMPSHKDIFLHRHSKEFEILEGGGKDIPVGLEIICLYIFPVIEDRKASASV